MLVLDVRNVNDAYAYAMSTIKTLGEKIETRNGPALRYPHPVTTVYNNPTERVLFDGVRDCNPFFHLMESMWMLAGQEDVEFLDNYNKGMKQYSDDGETFHGAYGYRWRTKFGFDQLHSIIDKLKENPNDRRCVLAMWTARDLLADSKDIPCNDTIKFDIRDGLLNMYCFNRSNDIIFGCYGANAVHFSFLQEYMAAQIGVGVGVYYQMSMDWHAYLDVLEKKWHDNISEMNFYMDTESPDFIKNMVPLVSDPENFEADLGLFMTGHNPDDEIIVSGYDNEFFPGVAVPMALIWKMWKLGEKDAAIMMAGNIMADDWRIACQQWMERRMK